MDFSGQQWQRVRKISFKKVIVRSPYDSFILSSYIDDFAKVCGKDGWVILKKGKIREGTYYFQGRDKALHFFCTTNCLSGVNSVMF
jgi:hypothetical protein